MEEILASIRKIIADDTLGTKKDEKKAPKPEPKVAVPEPVDVVEEDEDVLDLASVATVQSAPAEVMVEMEEDLPEMTFEPAPVVMPPPVAAAPAPAPVQTVAALEDRIISDNAGSLVSQAFATLSRHTAMPAVGRSLEDVVVELVRPMLRGWIDDNLPAIVEKLVKTEIERVARGG
ncbi:MAG: hypothetical protein CFE31_07995 [Rhizobiales bacterium PAR1]|nr:MAG: hypothetical protein CFE31_07995 [Rhizobiales bacterium PAR1]